MSDPAAAPPPPPKPPLRRPPVDGKLPPLVYALIACLFVTLVILLVTAHHVRRMRRLRRARQEEEEQQQRAQEAAAAGIAALQLRHVWIPPIVVNPDASMALAHSSGAWKHDAAAHADVKQHGGPASGGNSSTCTCGGTHCGLVVVVHGQETAFSHVSLSPAMLAER
ncbi:hypothetical protein COHA_010090 [Chlorella ohadii]|uniref:Uncharacterized protein n=1 Tax=Chlorella ohadii TaxID=2649997 RepID=A0AAD5DFY1_9CHLO|nr:hypothetical protein COHA_010090 [Chlorella ohadii]